MRAWRSSCGCGCARCRLFCALRARLGFCLLKDTHNLRLKFRKFDGEHRAAGMQDQVEAAGQQVQMAAQGLAHAALDAVALMRLAQHLARGEPDARTRDASARPAVAAPETSSSTRIAACGRPHTRADSRHACADARPPSTGACLGSAGVAGEFMALAGECSIRNGRRWQRIPESKGRQAGSVG